jgi:hypothetical protein
MRVVIETAIRSHIRRTLSEIVSRYNINTLLEKGERDTPGRLKHDSRPDRVSVRRRIGEPMARAIEVRDDNRCVYCRRTKKKIMSGGGYMTFDHLMPKDDGGGLEPSNLVLACSNCNFARQKRPLKQWMTYAAENMDVDVDLGYVRGQARKRIEPIYARDIAA